MTKRRQNQLGRWVNHHGVTYLLLMFSVVIIGISVTVAAKQWKTIVQRELEADLLAKGLEIQRALALYSATKKKGRLMPGEFYPRSLEELTKRPKPFLRKPYRDPVSRGEWEYIKEPKGGIKGVRSPSTAVPIKQHGFPPELLHFEGRQSYKDWAFEFPNPSTPRPPPARSPSPTRSTLSPSELLGQPPATAVPPRSPPPPPKTP